MTLFALGLNHQTAPLDIRERVAFATHALEGALGELVRGRGATEAAILSTCNRTEVYVSAGETQAATAWLAEYHRLRPDELSPYLYTLPRDQAVRHAFRVASGLDSMVLGEPQILGQLKEAVRVAESAGTLGTILHKLFQRSFAVAKEVRTNTQVGANSVSMAAASVKLAARIFPSLHDQKVLLIGAGEMIELCATHFAAQAPARITVANRTLERGHALARRFNAHAIELRELTEHLHEYDIVVSCTASSLPILGKGLVERALKTRRHRPIFMVDLAVPRDIEREVGDMDDVFLYTVDDLQQIVQGNLDSRRSAVEQAEAIIETQVGQFMHWMAVREAVPLIRKLREHAEEARQHEVDRALKLLHKGEDPKQVLEALSQGLTNKLIHGPTQALNEATGEERRGLADTIARLFPAPHLNEALRKRLDGFSGRLEELNGLLASENAARDRDQFRKISREHAELTSLMELYTRYRQAERDAAAAREMAADASMQSFAEEELKTARAAMQELEASLQQQMLPKDANDERNVFLEIRAGTGGDESALFAGDLLRMYVRYAERQRWVVELISESQSELGGYKEVVARFAGQQVYSKMKFESGGHRVQRVPETEAQGRIHTSACTVAVLPEADAVDEVALNPAELRIDTYRASGAGGQHVNKTDSAIRVTHLPTGIVVECQDSRSQHKNREKALGVLAARIKDRREREIAAKTASMRKSLIGSGDRSERIRTYNFPQGRVTDHRINLTLYKIERILDGELDELIAGLVAADHAERLAQLAEEPT